MSPVATPCIRMRGKRRKGGSGTVRGVTERVGECRWARSSTWIVGVFPIGTPASTAHERDLQRGSWVMRITASVLRVLLPVRRVTAALHIRARYVGEPQ